MPGRPWSWVWTNKPEVVLSSEGTMVFQSRDKPLLPCRRTWKQVKLELFVHRAAEAEKNPTQWVLKAHRVTPSLCIALPGMDRGTAHLWIQIISSKPVLQSMVK